MKVKVKKVHVLGNVRSTNKSYSRYIVAEYEFNNIDDIVRYNNAGTEMVKLISGCETVDVFPTKGCEILTCI